MVIYVNLFSFSIKSQRLSILGWGRDRVKENTASSVLLARGIPKKHIQYTPLMLILDDSWQTYLTEIYCYYPVSQSKSFVHFPIDLQCNGFRRHKNSQKKSKLSI